MSLELTPLTGTPANPSPSRVQEEPREEEGIPVTSLPLLLLLLLVGLGLLQPKDLLDDRVLG